MKRKEEIILVQNAIAEFKQALQEVLGGLLRAGEIYVQAIDTDKDAKAEFQKAFPQVCSETWARIERIGRKQLDPRLALDASITGSRLRALPYSEQQRALDEGVEVLLVDGETLKVKAENLTDTYVNQVVGRDGIRDLGAQRAYIESLKTAAESRAAIPKDRWSKFGKDKISIPYGGIFDRQDLVNMMQAVTPK